MNMTDESELRSAREHVNWIDAAALHQSQTALKIDDESRGLLSRSTFNITSMSKFPKATFLLKAANFNQTKTNLFKPNLGENIQVPG